MKSPNTSLTSRVRASLAGVRKPRTLCSAIALMMICPLALTACQSTNSGHAGGSAKGDNPYAKYDPKTPEEQEYYRDVYSGDWSEDSEGGLASVYKHSGSTTLPKHWQSMPPGAKTLEEIRFEASQRKMAEMRAMGRPAPSMTRPAAPAAPAAPVASAPVPSYSAPSQAQASYPVPAPTQTPAVNSYPPTSAPLAQPYAAAQPAAAPQNAYAQQTVAPVQNTAAQYAVPAQTAAPNFVAQAPAASAQQGVQFVAQAPAQPKAPAVQQPVATPQGAPQQAPAAQAPATYPQPQPSAYPNVNISASVDLFDSHEWLVRGQEPEEDDPFADAADEDPFADSEPADDSDDAEDAAEEDAAPVDAAPVAEEEPAPAEEDNKVEMTTDNVTVKTVTPEAKAGGVVVAPAEEANAAPSLSSVIRAGGKKLLLKIDPSIAAPFANVHRPTDATDPKEATKSRGEYVVSGGDANAQVISRKDWSVENLEPEDSVAHFDTIDGRILTEPSNRVFLYSPRFGAVRQIVGPIEGDHREGIEIANTNEGAVQGDNIQGVDVRSNEVRPLGAKSAQQPQGAETTVGVTMSTGLQGTMEGDAQIRLGAMLTSETTDDLSSEDASLMLDGAIAAQGWSGEQGVAVSTDLVNAFSNAYVEGASTVYQIKDDTKTSKLRVIKIANKEAAKPGEFVEFTLRFENIGDQPIGNVTILDNLSSRLRYVDGTAQSSVQADFLADLNEKGSLVLRWEIEKPLYPKEFGVVRFICKVQ